MKKIIFLSSIMLLIGATVLFFTLKNEPKNAMEDESFIVNNAGVKMTEEQYKYLTDHLPEVVVRNLSQELFDSAMKDINNIIPIKEKK